MGIIIAFLGVGMVAIPTGIISAGFVEKYRQFSVMSVNDVDMDVPFIQLKILKKDRWADKKFKIIR